MLDGLLLLGVQLLQNRRGRGRGSGHLSPLCYAVSSFQAGLKSRARACNTARFVRVIITTYNRFLEGVWLAEDEPHMKRSLACIALTVLTVLAWAQAPFTIVRPADGAKVRETIRVQIPKGSIPEGSYVGIFVGGKFVEATILDLNGKYYEYLLDTKKRGIGDGPVKLEVVLYSDFGDKPRVVDRSSVNVTVSN